MSNTKTDAKVPVTFRQDHVHAGVLYKAGATANFEPHEAAAIRRAGSAEESGGRKAPEKDPPSAAQ